MITLWHPLRGPAGRIFGTLSLLALAACGGGNDDSASAATSTRAAAKSGAAASTTTAGALDPLAALTVTSSVPGDGGNNQPRTRQPSFTFSSLLNAASVNSGNFSLRHGATPVPAALRVIDRVARLEPAAKLLPQTQYTVRAEPGILDTFGQTLVDPVQRSFVTVDGTWKELQGAPANAFPIDDATTAIDARGNTWMAWAEQVGNDNVLKVQRFNLAAGAWEPPVAMTLPVYLVRSVQLTFDDAGNGVLVWEQHQPSGQWWFTLTDVWASRFSAAAGLWEQPQQLSNCQAEAGKCDDSRLALRPNGEVAVAWLRRPGVFGLQSVEVTTARSDSGGWSLPARIDPVATSIDGLALALSPQAGGPAAIVFREPRSGQGAILWASVTTQLTQWLPASAAVVGSPDRSPIYAKLAVDTGGTVHLAWESMDQVDGTTRRTVWTQRHQAFAWGEARRLSTPGESAVGLSIGTSRSSSPQTWAAWTESSARVKAVRLRTDGGTETPQLVGATAKQQWFPDATSTVVDAAGNVLVGWIDRRAPADTVKVARHVGRLAAWQPVRTLDEGPSNSYFSQAPQLSLTATGDALAAWRAGQIFMRRFD